MFIIGIENSFTPDKKNFLECDSEPFSDHQSIKF